MISSDRIIGLVVILGALAYIVSAFNLQTSFLSDPVGSKTFPMIVGSVAALCGLVMIVRPDPETNWPDFKTWGALGAAVIVLVAYAYALKPVGFLAPTALAASAISFLIRPRALPAVLTGLGLSVGLFILFKYGLGLGLVPLPKWMMG